MHILVTGHRGYIGSVLVPSLQSRGHQVTGLDLGWFGDCTLVPVSEPPAAFKADIREISAEQLEGVDAVVHLAALSNDPLGDLDPALTESINTGGTARLVAAAGQAGVSQVVLASSCSVYGPGAGDDILDECSPPAPLTAYAKSKVDAEAIVMAAASSNMRTTVLRGSTVYGPSPRLRLDLVVNELVATAVDQGTLQLRSSGMAWRPFIHVMDFCAAFVAVLEAPPNHMNHQCYNIGSDLGNHRILDVAKLVADATGASVSIAEGAGADTRNYRVSFARLAQDFPDLRPIWTMGAGIAHLVEIMRSTAPTTADIYGDRYRRLPRLRALVAAGALDAQLRPALRAA